MYLNSIRTTVITQTLCSYKCYLLLLLSSKPENLLAIHNSRTYTSYLTITSLFWYLKVKTKQLHAIPYPFIITKIIGNLQKYYLILLYSYYLIIFNVQHLSLLMYTSYTITTFVLLLSIIVVLAIDNFSLLISKKVLRYIISKFL